MTVFLLDGWYREKDDAMRVGFEFVLETIDAAPDVVVFIPQRVTT